MIRQELLIIEDKDIELLLMTIDVTILFMQNNEGELEEGDIRVRKLTTTLRALADKLKGI